MKVIRIRQEMFLLRSHPLDIRSHDPHPSNHSRRIGQLDNDRFESTDPTSQIMFPPSSDFVAIPQQESTIVGSYALLPSIDRHGLLAGFLRSLDRGVVTGEWDAVFDA